MSQAKSQENARKILMLQAQLSGLPATELEDGMHSLLNNLLIDMLHLCGEDMVKEQLEVATDHYRAEGKKLIFVDLTAHNMDGNGSFSQTFQVFCRKELSEAVKSFRNDCPFHNYDMDTYAYHEDESELSPEEREWFKAEDEKENIGFIQ